MRNILPVWVINGKASENKKKMYLLKDVQF